MSPASSLDPKHWSLNPKPYTLGIPKTAHLKTHHKQTQQAKRCAPWAQTVVEQHRSAIPQLEALKARVRVWGLGLRV